MSLTEHDRRLLEKAIAKARMLFEEDFSAALEGRYGIHASGRVEEGSALALPTAETAARDELVGVVDHLRTEGMPAEAAVARVLREGVFTTVNRLVAVRVAEAIGLLPESLGLGRASRGYREILELFPLLTKDATAGYWTYLRLCADELAHDAPVLFDPRNPLLVLEPSPKTLDELLAIFADPSLAPVWADPEAFGWTYQYFNLPGEGGRDESSAPRNSRELAVRNQFFTPRYVVDFLVHNTLGRRLVESDPETALRDRLQMLVDAPDRPRDVVDLEEIRVLDPAVGSAHFLLGCYDVLEWAWEERGVSPAKAARHILPRLWGIDIDPRCAQVAAAALILRARRSSRDGPLPRPNVFTARPLPADPKAWERALATLDSGLRGLVERIRDVLSDSLVLGSLLKVDEQLKHEIERYSGAISGEEGTLFAEGFASDAFGRLESQILSALKRIADEASSTAPERLLAAEAADAFGFVEAMRTHFDAVLMNPPFGEPVPGTKPYLKAAYPWIPWKDYNLLAPFVGRGLELLRSGGYLGAITSRAGMFQTTFEEWRRRVLLSHRIVALADLGFGVMEGALVEGAAYVIGASRRQTEDAGLFIRLLKKRDRAVSLGKTAQSIRTGKSDPDVYRIETAQFEEIPGAPLAYWVPQSIRQLFRDAPGLEGHGAEVRQGLNTGENDRFVRAFWEVDARKIARSAAETHQGKRWAPFAKGGEYSPFLSDIHLLVEWERDGARIRETGRRARVQNARYYFRSGVTWPERTTSGFAPYVLPKGCVISHVGHGAFPLSKQSRSSELLLLGYLNSRLVRAVMEFLTSAGEATASGTAARHYLVGLVQRLPWVGPRLTADVSHRLEELTRSLVATRSRVDEGDETSRRYLCPEPLRVKSERLHDRVVKAWDEVEGGLAAAVDRVHEMEALIHSALELGQEGESYLDEEYAPNPARYPIDLPDNEVEFKRLYMMPIDQLVDEALAITGGSRAIATKSYFFDRRLEVLAHVFARHPSGLIKARHRLELLPPEELYRSTEDLISWLVGCALGRWDVRIGRDSSLAPPLPGPFETLPLCSPGMLVGPDGLPVLESPPGYPLELPPDRLLLDEEGHSWDVVLRVRRAAEALFEDSDTILEELERILSRDLRTYFKRDFFKAHLARYTKSRRKAPIYWHLSVPSRDWGIWAYAPTLSRETLFGILREGRRKETELAGVVGRLKSEVAKGEGREGQRLAKRLEAEERLLGEVASFAKEAEQVANLGWEPDLDDGFILCAAPLADLFPAWRAPGRADAKHPADPTQARRMIKAGKYPWATVSKWTEVL